jgi:hypothetical protein
MKKALFFALYAASVLVAGCETAKTTTAADRNEGDVITGSRIPRKGGSGAESVGTMGQDAYKQGQIERSGSGGVRGN